MFCIEAVRLQVKSDLNATETNCSSKSSSSVISHGCPKASPEGVTSESSAEDAPSAWTMDEFASEGAGNYCASVSSEDDKGAKSEMRRTYRCSKCGAEKKGHVCSAKTKEQTASSPIPGVNSCFRSFIIFLSGLKVRCADETW